MSDDRAPSPESTASQDVVSPSDPLRTALTEVDALRRRVEKERKKRKKAEAKAGSKGKLGTSRGIETMFRTSYRTHSDLSQLADNKANIMISINGIIISILLASIPPRISADPWLLAPTAILLVACVISMVYAVLAARPRIQASPNEPGNILFFGNFVELEEERFVEEMRGLLTDTDELYVSMIRDIYALGRVLTTKFRLLRISYTVFMAGLVAGVALFLAVFTAGVVSPGGPIVIP